MSNKNKLTMMHLKRKYKNVSSLPIEAICRSAISTYEMQSYMNMFNEYTPLDEFHGETEDAEMIKATQILYPFKGVR
jgi:hypothetical protein